MDTAHIAHVNRNTANHYFQKFRKLILNEQIKQRGKFLSEKETEVDETYFGPTRVKGKRGRGASKKVAVIGLLQREGKVFTKPVDNCTKEQLMPIILDKVAQGVDIYTDGWKSYDALGVYRFNHKRVKHRNDQFSNGNGKHINGIESFWSYAKRRLAKFNGIRKDYFDNYLNLN